MNKGSDARGFASDPAEVGDRIQAERRDDGPLPLPGGPTPDEAGEAKPAPGRGDGPGDRGSNAHEERTARPWRGPYRRQPAAGYAALDLGTNNCRLLIAEPRGSNFRVVDSFSRIVRLGEGVSVNGRLGEGAMDRAVEALRICADKLGARQIARARLIATEACRRAENGEAFLQRVLDETGLDLEVIDRRTEARLAVAGCTALLDPQADGAILFDIGGGSSEIVWLDRRRNRRRGLMRAWVSLPVGVVTLAERHGGVAVSPEIFERMVVDVRDEFHRFRARDGLRKAIGERQFHFLGTSGTVTTLAGVHLELPRYNRRRVDGLWMQEPDIGAMIDRIVAMGYEERVANPCIGRERADLVLAGCAIFEAIRREWPLERLRVADRGLREGILVNLMRADGHLRSRGNGRA